MILISFSTIYYGFLVNSEQSEKKEKVEETFKEYYKKLKSGF